MPRQHRPPRRMPSRGPPGTTAPSRPEQRHGNPQNTPEPKCGWVCPCESAEPEPDYPENRETLLATLHRLQQAEGQPPADAQATPAAAADAQPRTAWHDGPEPA